jgi:hypothetical protein
VALAALVLPALLAGCGEDSGDDTATEPTSAPSSSESSDTPTETPTDSGEEPEPTTPACSEVWVAGQVLAQGYDGCFDEDKGRWVQAMVYHCSSGQRLVTYGRTFYAAKGEKVNETDVPLARDPEFKKVLATCGA